MKPYPYLNCRKGIYQFRRIVPQKLRPILGQCEVVLSLATKDQKIARKAALEMGDLLDDLFAKIRSGAKLLSVADVELVSHHINKTKTEALMIEALEEFKNRQKEDEEWEAFHARTFRQEIKDDLRISSLDSAKPFVEELLVGREVSVPPDSAIYKQLCRAALKALDEFYKNAEIIVRGQFEHPRLIFDEQDTQIIEPLIVEGVEILKGDVTFKEAIDKYLTDNSSNWRTKQTENVKALLTYFLDYLSEDDGLTSEERTLGSVRGPMARAYKEHLQSAPSNSKKKYPGLSPRQSVEAAKSDGTPVLASETQNNYLQRLSTLYTFASTELDYEGKNPFKGRSNTKVRKGTNRDKRHSFSHQQLLDLFSSPIYTGCKSLPSCHRTGTLIPNRSHKYWTPLIGLFTGMRMQEILQLYVEDIYQQDDIWLLDLNDKHKDQTIKYSSHRKVPIHRGLVDLGFIEFLKTRDTSGRLFPDAPRSKSVKSGETYSDPFSKWFNRYLKNTGIKTKRTTFHSLRHNMKDFFRETGADHELSENFLGRMTGTVGEAYGSGFSLKSQYQAVSKIDFKWVSNLAHSNKCQD